MSEIICGIRCSAKNPSAFKLIIDNDKKRLMLSWTDTIYSETVVIGPNGKEITGTEHFLNEISREIRDTVMGKFSNRK
jgi:hypothetical protein